MGTRGDVVVVDDVMTAGTYQVHGVWMTQVRVVSAF